MKRILSLLVFSAIMGLAAVPASASVFSVAGIAAATAPRAPAASDVVRVDYRAGRRHHRYTRYYHRRHLGFYSNPYLYAPPRYIAPGYYTRPYYVRPYYVLPRYAAPFYSPAVRHVEWCLSRYRSYRVSDDTFQPYKGPRRACLSPYRR